MSKSRNIALNYPLFSTFTWRSVILVSKVTDVQRLSKIKKNIRIVLLNSFILQFYSVQHVTDFLRSHHNCTLQCQFAWNCTCLSLCSHVIGPRCFMNYGEFTRAISAQAVYVMVTFDMQIRPCIGCNLQCTCFHRKGKFCEFDQC